MTMTTDPSSLFLAAALAAGLFEGSSVIHYYRHALQQGDVSDNDSSDNANNDNDAAVVPSMSIIAAHSLLYGVASVPLGIVGASPGLVFLPKSLSSSIIKCDGGGDDAAAIEDATNKGEKRTVKDVKHHNIRLDDSPSTSSDIPIVQEEEVNDYDRKLYI